MKSGLMLGVNPNAERHKEDFYATYPKALEIFLNRIQEDKITLNNKIWECACGQGHLSRILEQRDYMVKSTDIVYRGYGSGDIDFLNTNNIWDGDILTNPPFKLAEKFIEKSMEILLQGNKLCLFLKIQFLEGQKRKELFRKYPIKYVYCNSSRQQCSKDGDFKKYSATTQFYAWYVWEKGYTEETILRWI